MNLNITAAEFESCLTDLTYPLAVAVSGGSDSLALLLLVHTFVKNRGGRVIALTVDHGLRPASQKEAILVKSWAREKGIEHVTLEWKGVKPSTRLQEKAREARYGLLTNWCKENGVSHLLLGHHAQDQEETFWMRLSSGSGLDGLSGMKKMSIRDGIFLHRPLLGFSKERLKATLVAENQEWIEDPTNQNSAFFRGRFRTALEEEGLTKGRLQKVMNKLAEDVDFIKQNMNRFLNENVQVHGCGYLTISRSAFEDLHIALAKRVISFLINWFRGIGYPLRFEQVEKIYEKIKTGKAFTAGGVYWVMKRDEIFLFREFAAIKERLSIADIHTKKLWDNRFWIDPTLKEMVSRETILGPLGKVPYKDRPFKIPSQAIPSLPALWEKGKVVAIFPLCYNTLNCDQDLQKIIYVKPLFHNSLMITM